MTPTLKDISRCFIDCNAEYFHNRIKKPTFKLNKSKWEVAHTVYYPDKKTRKLECVSITFSEMFDMSYDMFKDVMFHELIHIYLAQQFIKDDGSHGTQWQKMADDINEKLGRHIKKTFNATPKFQDDTLSKTVMFFKSIFG